jgi:hypothetical protein
MPLPSGKEGCANRAAIDLLVANCAPVGVPSACKIAANDLAGVEVCAGLELASPTDEKRS